MKIHEFQAKDILKTYGVPVKPGIVATTPEQAVAAAEELVKGGSPYPFVVKAQVHAGGRGKAGGVKLAKDKADLQAKAKAILGLEIKGIKVRQVLITPAANIAKEIYLGIILDRGSKLPVILASAAGGIDIEEVAATNPEKILKLPIPAEIGLQDYMLRRVAKFVEVPPSAAKDFMKIAKGLIKAFYDLDCSLAEINPLIVDDTGAGIALDAKMNFDDNALYKHPELQALRDEGEEDPLENEARKKRINYVKLSGKIGCIVNGAGLAMATMDGVKLAGGEPANFLDIGGGAKAEQVTEALKLITSDPDVNTIFFNIFGGIVRCDLVAEGILTALKNLPGFAQKYPIVIRLIGTNDKIAHDMLRNSPLISVPSMAEGAAKAVELAARR